MEPGIDYASRCPDVRTALWALEHYMHQTARQHFDDKELIDLTAAIVAINGWVGTPAPGDREAYSTSPGQPKAAGR